MSNAYLYHCFKCGHKHNSTSKIGVEHFKFDTPAPEGILDDLEIKHGKAAPEPDTSSLEEDLYYGSRGTVTPEPEDSRGSVEGTIPTDQDLEGESKVPVDTPPMTVEELQEAAETDPMLKYLMDFENRLIGLSNDVARLQAQPPPRHPVEAMFERNPWMQKTIEQLAGELPNIMKGITNKLMGVEGGGELELGRMIADRLREKQKAQLEAQADVVVDLLMSTPEEDDKTE